MQNAPIKDRLNLWADQSQTAARGEVLLKLSSMAGFTAKAFAKDLGVNRSVIYQQKVRLSQKAQFRLRDLTRIIDNAFLLFEGNETAVFEWLFSPSRRFYNMTPFNFVMAGKGETIYEWQENLINDNETFKT